MIYDFPDSSSPISQGDIFINVPLVDLPSDELISIAEDETAERLTWEEFASGYQVISSVLAVRPAIGIVGSQDCDNARARDITLFEVRPFKDVERKSKDTNKASGWVSIITQHARVNQKWFYLPPDETIGFIERMGADFQTPIRVPRTVVERLVQYRVGRLNDVAAQHFRERLGEFFRRYAYDEWYALSLEELEEYRKRNSGVSPYPWQGGTTAPDNETHRQESSLKEKTTDLGTKGYVEYLAGVQEGFVEFGNILNQYSEEQGKMTSNIIKHTDDLSKYNGTQGNFDAVKMNTIYQRAAGDIVLFAKKVDSLNPRFEKAIKSLEEDVSGFIEWQSAHSPETKVEDVRNFRSEVENTHALAVEARNVTSSFRDVVLGMSESNIHSALNMATHRQARALDELTLLLEDANSFFLKTLFLINERFGDLLT